MKVCSAHPTRLGFGSFEFWICFEFRNSYFGFPGGPYALGCHLVIGVRTMLRYLMPVWSPWR